MNARIIDRLLDALERFERGELRASAIEHAAEASMRALDHVDPAEESEARRLCVRLVTTDLANPPITIDGQELAFEGDEAVEAVVADFRQFLAQLPR